MLIALLAALLPLPKTAMRYVAKLTVMAALFASDLTMFSLFEPLQQLPKVNQSVRPAGPDVRPHAPSHPPNPIGTHINYEENANLSLPFAIGWKSEQLNQ